MSVKAFARMLRVPQHDPTSFPILTKQCQHLFQYSFRNLNVPVLPLLRKGNYRSLN